MAGSYCGYCGRRCFVSRQVFVGGMLVWSGHMATCKLGMEHDRKQIGMDFRTAHNPAAGNCWCINVCGPELTS